MDRALLHARTLERWELPQNQETQPKRLGWLRNTFYRQDQLAEAFVVVFENGLEIELTRKNAEGNRQKPAPGSLNPYASKT